MTDNEFILFDRLQKIKTVIAKYGEQNFIISFSGGKDSVVMSELIDLAIPNNEIPRVYSDTGIELNMIRDFVYKKQLSDKRIKIIKPSKNIKKLLETEGYPFKSKQHSKWVDLYQRNGMGQSIHNYLDDSEKSKNLYRTCPKKLKYQFREGFDIRVSDKCCTELKEKPIELWEKQNGKKYSIVGIMREEGGRRENAQCLAFKENKLEQFHPLAPLTKDWEEWFIQKYNVEICEIYREPYNFKRTGCKGCPFALNLQNELDILEKFFPNERKQCENIWKPIYNEYRRIGYRLSTNNKKDEYFCKGQLSIDINGIINEDE